MRNFKVYVTSYDYLSVRADMLEVIDSRLICWKMEDGEIVDCVAQFKNWEFYIEEAFEG